MKQDIKEYINSLIIKELPKGMDLLEEGRAIGKELQPGKNKFFRECGYNNFNEYKVECMKNGKNMWQLILGRANNSEQVKALQDLYEFTQSRGIECRSVDSIPSMELGLPINSRDANVGATSFVLNNIDDYIEQVESVPIMSMFGNHVLSCPNAIATTTSCIKAGNSNLGYFSQYIWHRQGFDDDIAHIADVIRSCGIVSVFYDDYCTIDSYPEDAFGGYFLDCVSIIAYTLLEHYILRDLCGCRSAVTAGGLLSEIPTRVAVVVALHKLLSTEDQLAFSFWNASTTDHWENDLEGNFGLMDTEVLASILANWHYGIGGILTQNAITEKLRVPLFKEQLDVMLSGVRVEEKAKELLPYINWAPMDEMIETLIRDGKIMFNNILEGFKESNVDIKDPMQLLMVLKNFNPGKFEAAFHPSTFNSVDNDVQVLYPTVLGRQTMQLSKDHIDKLVKQGKGNSLANKNVVIGSGDGHTYAVYFLDNVLSAVGANVINGGVDLDPVDFLDLADEEGCLDICITVHNGQCYDYAKECIDLAKERGIKYNFYMGGRLSTIHSGDSTPTDMTAELKELGFDASNNIFNVIDLIFKNGQNLSYF